MPPLMDSPWCGALGPDGCPQPTELLATCGRPSRLASPLELRMAVRDIDLLLGDAEVEEIAAALRPLAIAADSVALVTSKDAPSQAWDRQAELAAARAARRTPFVLEGSWSVAEEIF